MYELLLQISLAVKLQPQPKSHVLLACSPSSLHPFLVATPHLMGCSQLMVHDMALHCCRIVVTQQTHGYR